MEKERNEALSKEANGVGKVVPENKPMSKPLFSFADLDAKSSVTVTWNSLKGHLLWIKAGQFLKAMKKDVTTWRSFETHWTRKQGENKARVTQIHHVLENKFEDESNTSLFSPRTTPHKASFSTSIRFHRKNFQKKLDIMGEINSEK